MRFSYRELETFFAQPLPGANETAEALISHAFEVEEIVAKNDDWELDIKILPDRAPDAKSALGMAREIAAVLNLPLKDGLAPLATTETARGQITFKAEDISHLLGVALGEHEIIDCLARVRVAVTHGEDDLLEALIPPERQDLNIKEDLAD
jgi:phenylalanyl-tRNA synthetase beta subunit